MQRWTGFHKALCKAKLWKKKMISGDSTLSHPKWNVYHNLKIPVFINNHLLLPFC